MVITQAEWIQHGDLLQWLALAYPGLTAEQYEAGYRLLADPDITDHTAAPVQELLAGCAAASAATLANNGRGRREGDEAREGAQAS